jgi:hypothetical protein
LRGGGGGGWGGGVGGGHHDNAFRKGNDGKHKQAHPHKALENPRSDHPRMGSRISNPS